MASETSTSQAGSSSLGLQNRLLEVAVVVGMDEETGLIPRKLNVYQFLCCYLYEILISEYW